MGRLLSDIKISNIGQEQMDAAADFLCLWKMIERERKDETKNVKCLLYASLLLGNDLT